MKEKIIYGLAFLIAFIIVTLIMIYAASAYRNIFAFDFTPVEKSVEIARPQLTIDNRSLAKLKKELIDSLHSIKEKAAYDTVTVHLRDTTIVDSLRYLLSEIRKLKSAKEEKVVPLTKTTIKNESTKRDSAYKVWIKNTVKLYEAMDTKKAAKIIQSYSDNIARDIIFSMKKKKAAEIIAELKPEVANRIISVQ